jgi:hypothetical protein
MTTPVLRTKKDADAIAGTRWTNNGTGETREVHRVENFREQFGRAVGSVWWSQPGKKPRRDPLTVAEWNSWATRATRAAP